MAISTESNFPESFDSDENLFIVHDSLRLRLIEDYSPGDTSIRVDGDFTVFARMPSTGYITLTEQCSDIDDRAISFYYTEFDATEGVISGLELLPTFTDVRKPKRITNVTVNVMSWHHESLKKALIAMQEFCGVQGTEDTEPFGDTLEGRINFLRRIVLQPKAWFTANKRTGNVPLEVEFKEMTFRLGTDGNAGDVRITWDFGDQTASTITLISATDEVPTDEINVYVRDTDQGTITKTYHEPGLYDVKLTVENDFGSDEVIFKDFINARVKAPKSAIIRLVENTANQEATAGIPPNGPFETVPSIRSPINTLIQIEIDSGENPAIPGYSYAGELLNDDGEAIDPITDYTWILGDDLNHPSGSETKASYSVGGIYDLKLRVDTEFGAYRITTYENCIDIVENTNLWMWLHEDETTVRSYEFGLISETFKLTDVPTLNLDRDDSFLDGVPSEEQQKREFQRNAAFTNRSTISSGQGGTGLLYWATGRAAADPITSEAIEVREFNGFSSTYVTQDSITRAWNWANLNSSSASYFLFGAVSTYQSGQSPTNQTKRTLSFSSLASTSSTFTADNYLNGASELTLNVQVYDDDGETEYGHFSVYRTAWKDTTGYIARNDGVGPFFRIKSFYQTEGTLGSPVQNIRKMQDIQGPTKLEGQLVDLSAGIYMLNNSGSVSKFSPAESSWTTGGPGVNSLLYRSLQDTTVSGYDSQTNTLLATSDHDKRAYLSFDYSVNAFLKFNEIDITFTTLGSRPEGDQFLLGVY